MVAVLLIAASQPLMGGGGKDAGAGDLKKLQGTWKFLSHEMDGNPTPPEQVAKLKITFTGDKFEVREGDRVVQAGTHKLDASKKPAQVDATVTDGEGKGSKMLGIYEFKGDTIKVCFDPMGKERPTSFTSKGGLFTAVCQREKK
jgi:uncharacterized protein (TIGR03067 family)